KVGGVNLNRCPRLLDQFSLLAKIANDDAVNQKKRGAPEFFASKLAPTTDQLYLLHRCKP
ncbi:hypothetical protein DD985_27500, partial [Pseudomonas sp. HMWF011]